METTVFFYKGYVGILSDPTSDAVITHPGDESFGVVCDASKVKFSAEAVEALKKVPASGDSIGEIDIFGAGDQVIFGWLGGYMKAFKPEHVDGSRDYNPSLIKASADVETPQDFKDFVDALPKEA